MKLFNTLTRSVEQFTPLQSPTVGMYTCGPTVYNYAHIGNLRTYVFEDILRRTLERNGYQVQHVMNITDVGHLTDDADSGEDKMEKTAANEHRTVWEIADYYTTAFQQDTDALNILHPHTVCKATDHIQEQIELIQTLEQKGFTYQIADGIYFNTSKLDDYGKLAKLDIAGLQEGARVDMGEKKRSTDFALWKFSPTDSKRQMEWDSPWGIGFPGWHIECSAMSMNYLGEEFDIHCGGIDHIPVHHTNEIAQNEGAVGHPVVRYWLHGEFLLTNDERMGQNKMSKSKGNFLTLRSLIDKGYDPLAYRYFILGAHYRSKLSFTFEALDGAVNALNKLRNHLREWSDLTEVDTETMERFMAAMNDDLDTPKALAVVWDMVRGDMDSAKKTATLFEMDLLLGLQLADWFEQVEQARTDIPVDVMELVEAREQARSMKDWKQSDALRDQIMERGYTIEDTNDGPRLYPAS